MIDQHNVLNLPNDWENETVKSKSFGCRNGINIDSPTNNIRNIEHPPVKNETLMEVSVSLWNYRAISGTISSSVQLMHFRAAFSLGSSELDTVNPELGTF